ncbi:hypothetical protein HPB51_025557 [Rhipicephalus microplus]|uniref:Uncharacterized protein n=1 Tax=Rhipicephalus microplus TaxID=6941 RepID=A0A9J6DQS3_RHIMP|nr:hypothetical protein HPB51_025557 [Rhipicephalus microplus]
MATVSTRPCCARCALPSCRLSSCPEEVHCWCTRGRPYSGPTTAHSAPAAAAHSVRWKETLPAPGIQKRTRLLWTASGGSLQLKET